jgi:hypothetical protein
VITFIHFLTVGRNLLLISVYISFAFSKIAALSAVSLIDAESVTENSCFRSQKYYWFLGLWLVVFGCWADRVQTSQRILLVLPPHSQLCLFVVKLPKMRYHKFSYRIFPWGMFVVSAQFHSISPPCTTSQSTSNHTSLLYQQHATVFFLSYFP